MTAITRCLRRGIASGAGVVIRSTGKGSWRNGIRGRDRRVMGSTSLTSLARSASEGPSESSLARRAKGVGLIVGLRGAVAVIAMVFRDGTQFRAPVARRPAFQYTG